jgi:DNA-binding transcriptional LysR family regulator
VPVELRQLRCFVAVAEELNFTAAAGKLFMTQQALSRVIKQLERDVGVPLFRRTTRTVELTDAGAAMLAPARRAIAAGVHATTSARRAHTGTRRTLRVDLSSASLETPATLLRRFRDEHPEIAVHQHEVGPEHGRRMLLDGRLDLLLGLVTRGPAELRREIVRREPVRIGLAEDHPLATRTAVPVAALAEEEFLLPAAETEPEWVDLITDACQQAGFALRRWAGVTHGSPAAADVVRERRCVVPSVAWAAKAPGVVFRPLVHPTPTMTWTVVTRSDTVDEPHVEAFLAMTRALAAERRW